MYPTYCLAFSEGMKLELSDNFNRMKEMGVFPNSKTFLDFVDECFARGYNDYLKELAILEGLNDI
jgi:hypothetical protein